MMKYLVLLLFSFTTSALFSQSMGLGFFNLTYSTISEDFIDATSQGFSNPEIQLNESGIAFGANGIFLFNKFFVGGGGNIAFLNSDSDEIKMNVGTGYGVLGYNFHFEDDFIVNAGARLGGFGNTLSIEKKDDNIYQFGDYSITEDTNFTSGSFLYGVEVNVIKMFPSTVPGLAVGISAYFMAPISTLNWNDDNNSLINGIEEGNYSHYGISLKIGGGAFF